MKEENIEQNTEEAPKELSTIEKANQAAERLERANEEKKKLLDREEKLYTDRMLGGKSEAGKPMEKKEETPEEYKKRVMRNEI